MKNYLKISKVFLDWKNHKKGIYLRLEEGSFNFFSDLMLVFIGLLNLSCRGNQLISSCLILTQELNYECNYYVVLFCVFLVLIIL